MAKDTRFQGRSIAALSEDEAKAALADLLNPPKAETLPRIPPRVRRAGLSPARGESPATPQHDAKEPA